MDKRRMGLHSVLGFSLALAGLPACEDGNDEIEFVSPSTARDAGRDAAGNSSRDAGSAGSRGDAGSGSSAEPQTIVGTAVAAGSFGTLAKALTDTGLVETLEGAGPFTVFAPTDEAFAALPPGTLDALSEEQLKTILLYHVVAGALPASALKAGPVATASELSAFVSLEGGVKVNDATVTGADVEASNGVIHVIDKVLLPPNLVEAAGYAGSFSTLLGAAMSAGLVDTLAAPDADLTLFAPTDAAFAALPEGTVAGLSTSQLTDVLTYHVVMGRVLSSQLSAGEVPTLLAGESVTVSLTNGVRVNDANVVAADVVTTNGVIHVIDGVLLPSD